MVSQEGVFTMNDSEPQFEQFVAQHGEVVAQAIIENLERFKKVRVAHDVSLKERWHRLMQDRNERHRAV
jgi:hypothetical protein